ncbi:MAG: hypothetical protein COV45_07860 [Deltaproteobacteria bacterium CG11_big_fil_rev_8_21_14_0_20_47_16]|nr:MAG: hypothetical protein COV45_07860 [Deltaproteobacteria bacterium CG11_big_fil_rev_8_21_14_0_20_47_16]
MKCHSVYKIIIFVMLAVSFIAPAAAETVQGDNFTLESALTYASQNNPQLRALYHETEAAKYVIPQVKSLDDPNVSVWAFDAPSGSFNLNETQELWFSVSQKIPLFGKLKHKGKIATAEMNMASESTRAKALEIQTMVEHAFHMLFLLEKQLDIARENLAMLRDYKKAALVKYESRTSEFDDPLKASLEMTQIEEDILGYERDVTIAKARLNRLLGREPDKKIHVQYSRHGSGIALSEAELIAAAKRNNPDIQSSHYAIDRSSASKKLAVRQFLPDVTLEAMYMKMKSGNNGMSYIASINVPFWGLTKQRNGVKEAKARLKASESLNEDTINGITENIISVYAEYLRAKKTVALYQRAALPESRAALNSARRAFESDKSTFLNLVEIWRRYKTIQDEYWQTLVAYESAITNMEQLVGISLRQFHSGEVINEKE